MKHAGATPLDFCKHLDLALPDLKWPASLPPPHTHRQHGSLTPPSNQYKLTKARKANNKYTGRVKVTPEGADLEIAFSESNALF